jgi:hypothetical protein
VFALRSTLHAPRSQKVDPLRLSPADNSGKVADLKKGALLKKLEEKNAYWKVRTFNGDVGWVESKSVEKR